MMRGPQGSMAEAVSSAESIELAARTLFDAHESGRCCAPIRSIIAEGDIAGAYAVQDQNTRRWMDAGRRLVGRTIGLTDKSLQPAPNHDQPDFGTPFPGCEVPDGRKVGPSP